MENQRLAVENVAVSLSGKSAACGEPEKPASETLQSCETLQSKDGMFALKSACTFTPRHMRTPGSAAHTAPATHHIFANSKTSITPACTILGGDGGQVKIGVPTTELVP